MFLSCPPEVESLAIHPWFVGSRVEIVETKEVISENVVSSDHCDVLAAAAILIVIYGGWVIVSLNCFGANGSNYRHHVFTGQ